MRAFIVPLRISAHLYAKKNRRSSHEQHPRRYRRGASGASTRLKLQRRAAAVGFDWAEIGTVLDAVRGELNEVRAALGAGEPTHIAEEIGDLLFACVNLARFARIDPESALRSANQKFERRFRYIEQRLQAQGQSVNDATLAEMDALWEEAKRGRPKKRGRHRRPRSQKEEAQSNRLVLSKKRHNGCQAKQ